MGAAISTLDDTPLTVYCGEKPEGATAVIRSPAWRERELTEIPFEDQPTTNTTFHVFQKTVREHGEKDFLGQRYNGGPFEFETYATVAAEVRVDVGLFVCLLVCTKCG
jgi:hypothetical protein